MKPYLLLLAIFYCFWCKATCLLTKVSVEDRTSKSEFIIEGKVIKQQSCWNLDKSSIFTVNTVEINNRLKGNSNSTIEIITPGGAIDGKLLVVEPNAELKVGSEGIFFLKQNTIDLKYTSSIKKYEIYAAAQGFIVHDNVSGKYSDPFDEYPTQSKVYSLINKTTNAANRTGDDASTYDVLGDASISYFTPASISAGTQSILTIIGYGFKDRSGQATVQFRNANSTSSTSFFSVDSTYIVSWTNTEIKVIVPGSSAFGNGGAGNGIVRVMDKNGLVVESLAQLEVTYNQFEYKKNRLLLIDKNSAGGYTFTLNDNFNANTDAKASFKRALDQWVCKTGVNATISGSTSTVACGNQIDNFSIVSFATASCPLPAGALGVTYSTYSICGPVAPIYPESIDIIFSPNAAFYFGAGLPSQSQFDFESVVLHELGHAFGQGHVGNGNELMYPSISIGLQKRTLNPLTDIVNVSDIVSRSITTATCAYPKHKKSPNACTIQTPSLSALFTTDKTRGCAPLTVNFTDQSTGNPTQWKWDISNNGTVDYTTQNPSHTFTTSGTYTVKLIAINASTQDSVIKVATITVAPQLTLNIDVLQNISCNGGNNGSLKAIPSGGDGNYSFTWNNNQTAQQVSSMPAGTYSVTLKDGYNCSISGIKTITQPQPLVVNIRTQLISGSNYTALLDISGGTYPYTYTLNNTAMSGPTLTNLNAGTYAITVKDQNSCIKNASFSIAAPTSVNEIESQFESLNVYPNPAKTNININFALKEQKTVKVDLFNLSGQTIFHDEYENVMDRQANIDLSNLANGTYLLKFELPEGNTFRKVIVNN